MLPTINLENVSPVNDNEVVIALVTNLLRNQNILSNNNGSYIPEDGTLIYMKFHKDILIQQLSDRYNNNINDSVFCIETFLPNQASKLFFDIDGYIMKYPYFDINVILFEIANFLNKNCGHKPRFSIYKNSKQNSYHIVVNNYHVTNRQRLVEMVKYLGLDVKYGVDIKLYREVNGINSLRLLTYSKPGDTSFKKFYPRSNLNILSDDIYSVDVEDINNSLVSIIEKDSHLIDNIEKIDPIFELYLAPSNELLCSICHDKPTRASYLVKYHDQYDHYVCGICYDAYADDSIYKFKCPLCKKETKHEIKPIIKSETISWIKIKSGELPIRSRKLAL